jgi:hypothetical protein
VQFELAEAILRSRLSAEAAAWLGEALRDVRRTDRPTDDVFHGVFLRRWSAAGRRLGRATLALSPEEQARLRPPAPALPPDLASDLASDLPRDLAPDGWGADECGRALLLLAALPGLAPESHLGRLEELYRTGELREQQALLRCLASLPAPERFVTLAIDAVRSNARTLVEAIACDNPFPATYLPNAAFNQMILKCLFVDLPLGRVSGLGGRRSPELARMVAAYASERRAAGRAVPEDAALVLEGQTHASR